jgi:uncharacterized sulfatase
MNFVIIVTDTQPKGLVGAYGNKDMDTPNIDSLADAGMRFDRAYTACPLCTPARASLFSGLYPQLTGAIANGLAPAGNIPLLGTIFSKFGYRTAYTGKWHLDGSNYYGNGVPEGGFEPDQWYDGKCYSEDIGRELFRKYVTARSTEDVRKAGLTRDMLWGRRVADRAVEFLQETGEQPFVLVASFDEPHEPYVAPPEYWEETDPALLRRQPNTGIVGEGKPELQKIHADLYKDEDWEAFRKEKAKYIGCNRFIDREIGRIINAVRKNHGDDTFIFYTSDHGTMLLSHGLKQKGPMMYEEITGIPLIVSGPGIPQGSVSQTAVSHVDIIPTMLELAGLEVPEILHGRSLLPLLKYSTDAADTSERQRWAFISWHRFAVVHDSYGEFYPIRCVTDGRFKLSINMFDADEFYDLETDPFEMVNKITDPSCRGIRDRLHDRLLEEMDRIQDPYRSWRWGNRPWRRVRQPFYKGGSLRRKPAGFSFEPEPCFLSQ